MAVLFTTVVYKLDTDNLEDRITLNELKASFGEGTVSAIMMGDGITQLDQIRSLMEYDCVIDAEDITKIIGN